MNSTKLHKHFTCKELIKVEFLTLFYYNLRYTKGKNMNKILIVDDEEKIVEVLKEYALFEGFLVDTAQDGEEAVKKATSTSYDCIIMDIMMPKMNGFDAVKEIKKHDNTPILMVSARSEEYDKLLGFELGIDDYIVKPFSPKEVMARVKAVIKRYQNLGDQIIEGTLIINKNSRSVLFENKVVSLTNKEYDLLVYLANNKNKAVERKDLLREVWGYDYYGDGRTVDTHIKMLRAHLGEAGKFIKTVHGIGYMFAR